MGRGWVAIACCLAAAAGASGDGPTAVAWSPGLPKAFAEAKASKRPIFVAINAAVTQKEGVETASKLLREQVYGDPAFVALTPPFVCVLLRDPLSTEDGDELRSRYGIEGDIVSPQHLFLHADGSLIQRKEYWEYGDVATSVAALGEMMARALKAHAVRGALPPLGEDAASRAAWGDAALALARTGPDVDLRLAAVRELASADRDGDQLVRLARLLAETKETKKEDGPVLVAVARTLGRPGFEAAVPGLASALEAKDAALRANAAVSLEYVGSAKSLEPILARAGKEKDEAVKGHLLRAAGRCGAKDPAVRKLLLREAAAKSDAVAASALIALGYFPGDADVARGVEKLLKGSREGLRQTAFLWTLVEVGDPGSAAAIKAALAEAPKASWGMRLLEAAVACFEGQRDARRGEIDQALRWALHEKNVLDARYGRKSPFTPKGDMPSSGS